MKLLEILAKPGFPLVPHGKHVYRLNKSSSVEFAPGEPKARLPTDDSQGTWEFRDDDGNFHQTITGKFKDSVKKAISSHCHLKNSAFSHTLKVIQK